MRYIKKYEKVVNSDFNEALDKFYQHFNKHKENWKNDAWSLYRLKNNHIPESLFDEFTLLSFYYDNWSGGFGEKNVNNYIKNEIKKTSKNSIIEKIENDINVYKDIEFCLNKNKKISSIHKSSVKYFIFFLDSLVRKDLPGWVKNAVKFNV